MPKNMLCANTVLAHFDHFPLGYPVMVLKQFYSFAMEMAVSIQSPTYQTYTHTLSINIATFKRRPYSPTRNLTRLVRWALMVSIASSTEELQITVVQMYSVAFQLGQMPLLMGRKVRQMVCTIRATSLQLYPTNPGVLWKRSLPRIQ